MDATQLRIGNFVYKQNSKLVKQEAGERDFIYKIENINIQSALKYDPIPITEELKEELKYSPLFIDKIGFVIFKNGYTYSFIWEDYPFLHQLQNLYFAIAGDELILNL
jgi:hypothetical protein